VVGAWLKELLGLPARASFAIVTGCQMANVTCLAAARHRLLAGRGWDAEQHGLFGAPPIRVLAGHTRHGSIDRALRLLGVGRSQIVELISGLVRFLCPRPEATPEDHDRFTDGTIAAIAAEGKAFFSGTPGGVGAPCGSAFVPGAQVPTMSAAPWLRSQQYWPIGATMSCRSR
jgi:hypothetical protein